jgi:hypothetical protein
MTGLTKFFVLKLQTRCKQMILIFFESLWQKNRDEKCKHKKPIKHINYKLCR